MKKLDILKSSLEKKQEKFNKKLNEHFSDVRSANGQPLNDKRNGVVTMRRWDKHNEVLSKMQKEIEKTRFTIENEESRLRDVADNKSRMPKEITDLIDNGTLKQWSKR